MKKNNKITKEDLMTPETIQFFEDLAMASAFRLENKRLKQENEMLRNRMLNVVNTHKENDVCIKNSLFIVGVFLGSLVTMWMIMLIKQFV